MLCFVDEVLRGTNTVERIAAATQILIRLAESGTLGFAATHDIEMTELLKEYYDNYHFEEVIRDGDILFPYQLLPGKASTRNAIRLLQMMGYEEQIIKKASGQAENFLKTGKWINTPAAISGRDHLTIRGFRWYTSNTCNSFGIQRYREKEKTLWQ